MEVAEQGSGLLRAGGVFIGGPVGGPLCDCKATREIKQQSPGGRWGVTGPGDGGAHPSPGSARGAGLPTCARLHSGARDVTMTSRMGVLVF